MGKLKKRADGYYSKSFIFDGNRYFVYDKDKNNLDDKAKKKLEELKGIKQEHDDPTIKTFYEKWKKGRQGTVKAATLRSQECHYNTVKNITIGNKEFKDYRLSEVTADDLRQIQDALVKSGNCSQTVNDKLAFLSHLFHDALIERYIVYNPCCAVKPLKRTEEKARDGKHRALTVEETKDFFDNAQDSFYLNAFKMCLLTGMRIGEVGALYNSDIYDNKIHVNRTITRLEDGSHVIGDDTKTIDGQRTIPLNDAIIEVIENQKAINKLLDEGNENVVFMNDTIFKGVERGLLLSTPVNREIKRICKRAGIEKFNCHAFRDTFATRAIESGVDPKTLQELLGHSDYKITMNLYAHVVDETKQNAMNKICINF